MSGYKRKYGVATANGTHIAIPIIKAGEANFAVSADWTPAAGDVKVTKNDGTPANITTLPTYVANQGWEFQFSAAELQCKKIDVLIVDQTATKAIEDQFFTIETYGSPDAMEPWDYSVLPYSGPRGAGVYLDDSASNTDTILGGDGTAANPVSTIDAAKTIADALGTKRIYLVNNTNVTLAATMEYYEFIGIGEIAGNSVNLGSQDVDNSYFENLLVTGTQGGSGRLLAYRAALLTLTGFECMAWECAITGNITIRDDCFFDKCWSAVAGNGTPTLDINSVANVDVSWRHYSGGLQINNAVSTTTISYETDGQVIIDSTCNSLSITIRGNCTITDNGVSTSITKSAAYNEQNIRDAMKLAPTAGTPATGSVDDELDNIYSRTNTLPIKKSTAISNYYFVMFDSNGSAVTGLAATISATISKDGASFSNLTGTISEIGTGVYVIPLSSSDTNFTEAMLLFTDSNAVPTYNHVITESA